MANRSKRCPKCGAQCEVICGEVICPDCEYVSKRHKPNYGERLERGFAMWNMTDDE